MKVFVLFLLILSNISSFAEINKNRSHVEKFVQHMAQFVGEEEFALKVGQALVKRSADVGLRVDGVVTNSGLEAQKVINQPLQDVHIDRHNAFSVPLTDAIALFGAIDELTLLRKQAFEAMTAKGISDQEAVQVLNDPGVKEILQETTQAAEKIKEKRQQSQEKFDCAASEILKRYQSMTSQERDDWLDSPESILTDRGLPLEYHILKQQAKVEASKETYENMIELTQLRQKIETIIQNHPKTVQCLKTTLQGLEWIADKVTDGVAIAGGGTYGLITNGPSGIVLGAKSGLAVKEKVSMYSAEAVNQMVEVATQPAVETAKTSAEKSEFQKTVDFFKTSSLSVFGLLGMRHFIKPTPSGKAVSGSLKRTLERQVTFKDGMVYAGKKNFGPISEMPTLRRFAKPKDAVLRKEFESHVFDREVMF